MSVQPQHLKGFAGGLSEHTSSRKSIMELGIRSAPAPCRQAADSLHEQQINRRLSLCSRSSTVMPRCLWAHSRHKQQCWAVETSSGSKGRL